MALARARGPHAFGCRGARRAGFVRINGARIEAPSTAVRCGDVVTIALDRAVRVLKVQAFAARRGSSDAAHGLYVELS